MDILKVNLEYIQDKFKGGWFGYRGDAEKSLKTIRIIDATLNLFYCFVAAIAVIYML